MGLLDAAGGRGRLAGRLGGELLAGSLSSGGLAGGFLVRAILKFTEDGVGKGKGLWGEKGVVVKQKRKC